MDLDLIRTFIELDEAGTMGKAAERLHVTQATVSSRIALLEAELGQRLFLRSKAGTQLTAEGKTFLPFARRLIGTWRDAQHEMSVHTAGQINLGIGGEFALSTALLLNWLLIIKKEHPKAQLRTVVDTAEHLLDAVQTGSLDIVTLYSPLKRARVRTKLILKEELICVSTRQGQSRPETDDYIYVDWGPDFSAEHERAFPELSRASTSIGLGPLALRYLLRAGGSGYFRTRAVEPFLRSKQLHRVRKMPAFSYSIYAARSPHAKAELLEWAEQRLVASLKQVAEPWA